METLKKNIVFLAVVITVIAGIAYWYISSSAPDVGEGSVTETSPEFESQYGETRQKILRTIAVLEGISLDTAVFDDPQFRVLTKAAVPNVGPIDIARRNPFVPVGGPIVIKPNR